MRVEEANRFFVKQISLPFHSKKTEAFSNRAFLLSLKFLKKGLKLSLLLFFVVLFIIPITLSFLYIFATETKSPNKIVIGTFIVGIPFALGFLLIFLYGLEEISKWGI